jgi:hypothetical protein
MRALVPRSDVRKRTADRKMVGQAKFDFHHDRMSLSRVVSAITAHAVAVQVPMTACEEVLVGHGEIASPAVEGMPARTPLKET